MVSHRASPRASRARRGVTSTRLPEAGARTSRGAAARDRARPATKGRQTSAGRPTASRTCQGAKRAPGGGATQPPGSHSHCSPSQDHCPSIQSASAPGLAGTVSTRAAGGGYGTSTNALSGWGAAGARGSAALHPHDAIAPSALSTATLEALTDVAYDAGFVPAPALLFPARCRPHETPGAHPEQRSGSRGSPPAPPAPPASRARPSLRTSGRRRRRLRRGRPRGRADLASKIATTPSPKFLGLFRGFVYDYELFDRSVLQRDLERVERYYRARGYYEAHARAGRVEYVSADHVRVVRIVGRGRAAGADRRRARRRASTALPERRAATPCTGPSREAAWRRGGSSTRTTSPAPSGAIRRTLEDRGYAFAAVERRAASTCRATEPASPSRSTPDLPATFGPITIEGLGSLPEEPVRRALEIEAGTSATRPSALDAAQQALLDLGVFSSVVDTSRSAPNRRLPTASCPSSSTCAASKLRSVRLGGGVELDVIKTDVHATAGWTDQNFLGGMRHFEADFRPGLRPLPDARCPICSRPIGCLPEERFRAELRQPVSSRRGPTAIVRGAFNVYPLLITPERRPERAGHRLPRGARSHRREPHASGRLYVDLSYNLQYNSPFAYVGTRDPDLQTVLISYVDLLDAARFPRRPRPPAPGLLPRERAAARRGILGGRRRGRAHPAGSARVPARRARDARAAGQRRASSFLSTTASRCELAPPGRRRRGRTARRGSATSSSSTSAASSPAAPARTAAIRSTASARTDRCRSSRRASPSRQIRARVRARLADLRRRRAAPFRSADSRCGRPRRAALPDLGAARAGDVLRRERRAGRTRDVPASISRTSRAGWGCATRRRSGRPPGRRLPHPGTQPAARRPGLPGRRPRACPSASRSASGRPTDAPNRARHGWPHLARSAARFIGVVLVFVCALPCAVLVHASAPALTRVVVATANRAMAGAFRGQVEVLSLRRFGLHGVEGAALAVRDPQGREVATANGVTVHIRLPALAWAELRGRRDVPIVIDDVFFRSIEATLVKGSDGQPTLALAFAPRHPKNTTTSPVWVTLRSLRGHSLRVRGQLGPFHELTASASAVEASLAHDERGTTAAMRRLDLRSPALRRNQSGPPYAATRRSRRAGRDGLRERRGSNRRGPVRIRRIHAR